VVRRSLVKPAGRTAFDPTALWPDPERRAMLDAGIDDRRFRVFRIVFAAAIVILAAPPAGAQGDPEVGRELARTWCTSCHVVDIEGQGADAGPALPALLGDGQRTEDELRGWLAAPHPPMPDFALSRQEIEDITAYLQGLVP
jgi:mono/diheme cytochrome c family protein